MAARGVIPFVAMALVQSSYSGMTITSKLAIQAGMSPLVLVAYRQIFATLSLAPFAYWLERNKVPRMTKRIGLQILISSLTGVTGNQILYFVGLKYSTATIASALNNLLPAFTFVLAVLCRQESLGIKTRAGQAKVIGTVVGVGGALLLSFYHGNALVLRESSIHWKFADKTEGASSSATRTHLLLGPLALIGSSLVWSIWFIVQADMSKNFPAPYTSSLYMCFLASIQCVAIALCSEHTVTAWSIDNTMRLTSALYAGVICTGLANGLISWTINQKGPLYVSVFAPLGLIVTALVSWAVLHDKLFVGTAIGSILIVLGLYSVLWGKSKDKMVVTDTMKDEEEVETNDLELQSSINPSNSNHNVAS